MTPTRQLQVLLGLCVLTWVLTVLSLTYHFTVGKALQHATRDTPYCLQDSGQIFLPCRNKELSL